jgi:predicted DCC family thiol-disulfide oxidoreductase YuxK
LGAFRIGFGLALLVDLLRRVPVLTAFYSNDGVLTNHFAQFLPQSRWLFSLYFVASSPGEAAVAFALTGLVYAAYTVGYRTRLMQILSFVLVTSLHSRNIMIENGGDVVMNLLALWTMFLPLGRRFSLDALFASWRAAREQRPADLNDRTLPPPPDERPVVRLACLAVLVQFILIYGFNALHKGGSTWREGTSLYYVLHQARMVTAFGLFCRTHLPTIVLSLLTWGTLVIEGGAALLLMSPVQQRAARWIAIALVTMLHIGIALLTNLQQFQLNMLCFLLLLPCAADWAAFAAWHRRRTGTVQVFYDSDCGFCFACCRLFKRLDPLGQIEFIGNHETARLPPGVTAEHAAQTVITLAGERRAERSAAFARILRTLPGWAPLGWMMRLPVVSECGDFVYDIIARNRHRISAAMGLAACGSGLGTTTGVSAAAMGGGEGGDQAVAPLVRWGRTTSVFMREGVVAYLIVAAASQILIENHAVNGFVHIHQPKLLEATIIYPRLFQGWSMFAPSAPQEDSVLVVDAVLEDGQHFDPIAGEAPRFEMVPPGGHYPMHPIWCDYMNRIRMPGNAPYRQGLRDYILHRNQHEGGPQARNVRSFEAFWLTQALLPPGDASPEPAVSRERILAYP